MLYKKLWVLGGLFLLIVLLGNTVSAYKMNSNSNSVYKTLKHLGAPKVLHEINYTDTQVKQGFELIHNGRTTNDQGRKTKYISKYYICTNCHNTVKEDPDLRNPTPEKRLDYAIEKDIPFLQGSPFYGIVNRTSWYNDDYEKKYGELVKAARKDLREAIRLCAVECSQGRDLESWEMEAIVAYFWTLELKITDLNMPLSLMQDLSRNLDNASLQPVLRDSILSYYTEKSPAHLGKVPEDKSKGYGLVGDPIKGEAIYDLSCGHCHRPAGVSRTILDNSKLTLQDLKRNIDKHSQWSIYHIIREGTYANYGHREYMPFYTVERMSDQQIEDLRAYIEQ